ncbi:hypothetical protein Agub_g3262 [Astrephomene gubernaculifera]|uniref:Histidine phosphatase family protein n=1 Tax=Astrephomene gubernaculifera TaxID=47775 RepID=A0AAD3DIC9_9CHLO|nr:hypothetical protein Agub_g3262 [Astrephomene gubernaculifera]
MATDSRMPAGIVVMRHGRREDTANPAWHLTAKFPFDTPLVASESEISGAAEHLTGRTFDVVYCSPFLRCIETAERLLREMGAVDVPMFIHRGLSEVHNPQLLFKCRTLTLRQRLRLWQWRATYRRHSRALRSRFRPKARLLAEGDWPQVPESEHAAAERLMRAVLQLAARHPGQQVLVVSHGKAVQVAHEVLGGQGRTRQVDFAGLVACRPRRQPQAAQQQTGDGVAWSAFEMDPDVKPFGVELVESG